MFSFTEVLRVTSLPFLCFSFSFFLDPRHQIDLSAIKLPQKFVQPFPPFSTTNTVIRLYNSTILPTHLFLIELEIHTSLSIYLSISLFISLTHTTKHIAQPREQAEVSTYTQVVGGDQNLNPLEIERERLSL